MSATFDRKIHETVSNPQLQLKIYTATGRLIEGRKRRRGHEEMVRQVRWVRIRL